MAGSQVEGYSPSRKFCRDGGLEPMADFKLRQARVAEVVCQHWKCCLEGAGLVKCRWAGRVLDMFQGRRRASTTQDDLLALAFHLALTAISRALPPQYSTGCVRCEQYYLVGARSNRGL